METSIYFLAFTKSESLVEYTPLMQHDCCSDLTQKEVFLAIGICLVNSSSYIRCFMSRCDRE